MEKKCIKPRKCVRQKFLRAKRLFSDLIPLSSESSCWRLVRRRRDRRVLATSGEWRSKSQSEAAVSGCQAVGRAGRRGRSTPPPWSLYWLRAVILTRDNLTTTLRLLLSKGSSVWRLVRQLPHPLAKRVREESGTLKDKWPTQELFLSVKKKNGTKEWGGWSEYVQVAAVVVFGHRLR